MTEEPYRWLEAVANRREYIRDQLKGGDAGFRVFPAGGNSSLAAWAPGSRRYSRSTTGTAWPPSDIRWTSKRSASR
jgi:hypothetical protein